VYDWWKSEKEKRRKFRVNIWDFRSRFFHAAGVLVTVAASGIQLTTASIINWSKCFIIIIIIITEVTSSTVAPFCSSSRTMWAWSPCAAMCSGLRPLRVRTDTDASRDINSSMTSLWPLRDAQCIAVNPSYIHSNINVSSMKTYLGHYWLTTIFSIKDLMTYMYLCFDKSHTHSVILLNYWLTDKW